MFVLVAQIKMELAIQRKTKVISFNKLSHIFH